MPKATFIELGIYFKGHVHTWEAILFAIFPAILLLKREFCVRYVTIFSIFK